MRFIVMQNVLYLRSICRAVLVPGLAAAVLASVAIPATAAGGNEVGLWYDDTGEGAVRIEPCGTSLCGKIVWLKDPLHDDGTPLIDRHNPEASKQKRTICGLQILGELKPSPDGGYDNGWVYDPKEGKSYSLAMKLSSKDELTITGYLGVKLLGKSFTWTRAKTELPSCAAPAAAPIEAKASSGTVTPAAASVAAGASAAATKTVAAPVEKPAPVQIQAPSAPAPSAPATAAKVATPTKPSATAAPAAIAAPASKPAAVKKAAGDAAIVKKKPVPAEVLPWADAKPAATKPAAATTNLGASGLKPAAKKKPKPPAGNVTQPRPETASQ